MQGRRVPAALAIAAVIALAITLHALQLAGVRRVSHDDTISYLSATGHQGEFQQVVDTGSAPVAQWVSASRWQAYTRIDDPLPLLRIAQDLGHHDIHPPLYFWVLHVWALLVGVHLWTGPALNMLLHVVTAVVLWRMARRVFGAALPAWAVTGIWATLPAVAQTVVSTRQYSMAGLWSVAFATAYLRTRQQPSLRGLLAVGASTALGMLTLYPFGFVVAGLGMVCLLDLASADRRGAALRQIGAIIAGGVVFLACQPWLREALARQQEQAEPYTAERMVLRARVLLRELPQFAISDLRPASAIAVLGVAVVLAALAWRARPGARPLVWLAVWVPGVMSVAYLAALSPGAAYEPRYFSIALPYLAFLPVLAWPYLKARPVAVVAAAMFVTAAIVNVVSLAEVARRPPAVTLEGPQPVVLDNLARGVLLRILWDAPPQLPVFAADQLTLLRTTSRWLRCAEELPCHKRPLVLATQVQYEATAAGRTAILREAAEVRKVTVAPAIDEIADRYRLSAPIAATARRSSLSSVALIHNGADWRSPSTMMQSRTSARNPAAAASAGYGAEGVKLSSRARYQNSVQ